LSNNWKADRLALAFEATALSIAWLREVRRPVSAMRESKFDHSPRVFAHLRVRPVINCSGIYTDLGGSRLSPAVWAAMTEANEWFVDMVELLERSGERIAALLGVEAARVTPGASAAIALGIAACIARGDRARRERLPETDGMPNEVILQRGHRYKYGRLPLLAGARVVEVGEPDGTEPLEIARAIGPRTAAVFLPAHLDGHHGTVPLTDVAALARERGVPVFVDAAYMNDPPALMSSFTTAGAGLVCFSAKYFGGPNGGGFLAGRQDLIDAVAAVDFTRHESGPYLRFGRAFKMDRQIVIATVLALEEWWAMDHAARWDGYRRQVDTMRAALADLRGLTLTPMWFTMDERLIPDRVNCLVVRFAPESGTTAQAVSDRLAAGSPSIRCVVEGDALVIVVETVRDEEVALVAARLREAIEA
jgi:D-glucosaminate-6-phosphate ammonia-lyase